MVDTRPRVRHPLFRASSERLMTISISFAPCICTRVVDKCCGACENRGSQNIGGEVGKHMVITMSSAHLLLF